MTHDIRANTVLPARRDQIELDTLDGLRLVGELAQPLTGPANATLITLHPLPTQGGFMDSHLLRKASFRLPALAGIAVLRFNTRGTASPRGQSEGTFDHGQGERFDVAAAIEFCDFHGLPNPWLVGWSFGSDLALMHGCDPAVMGAILLSPPRRYSSEEDLAAWTSSGKPVVALVPEFDDFLRPAQAVSAFAALKQVQLKPIADGKHLWVGEALVQRALHEITAVVAPDQVPLATTYQA